MIGRLFVAVALLVASVSAQARIGTIDQVPSATLLFPHFEVDPDDPNGVNTLLNIQNASASAGVVNVTLWTDYGIPTATFAVYLTGYDAETIDMRQVFARRVPITGDAGEDPNDAFSPKGPLSQDINFPGTVRLSDQSQGNAISRAIIAAHTGGADLETFAGNCGARSIGDGIARGYVTVDTMVTQQIDNPSVAGYFDIIDYRNIYMGDYVIISPSAGNLTADTAVHIEASLSDPLTTTGVGKQTFYGRFVNFTAADHREPLPTAWLAKYSGGRTNAKYWRDPGVITAPFACGGSPASLPGGQRQVRVFDANGTTVGSPAGDLFPFVSGDVSGAALGLTAPLGSVFVNLNLPAPVGPLGSIRQSWMTWFHVPSAAPTNGPVYAVPGVQVGNAAFGDDPIIP